MSSFTCPECGATSHHPEDLRHGYCGACHAFTGPERQVQRRDSIVPSEQDYADAREAIASLIREKVAPGLRTPTNQSIHQAYGLVIEALYEQWAEMEALRNWAFDQLNRIINAVRGEPEPNWQHSLHDVVEQVERALRESR